MPRTGVFKRYVCVRACNGGAIRAALAAVLTMAIAAALLAMVFSSCKSGKSKPAAGLAAITANGAFATGNATRPGAPGGRAVSSVEGPGGTMFSFEPLDGDDSPDRRGAEAYELTVEEKGDEVHLTIRAKTNAQYDWKYVLGYVYYDPEKYNPVKFAPGGMFGDEEKRGEDHLDLAILKKKGVIPFWYGLANWDEKDGVYGGVVGTFVFKEEPWDPGRAPSRAPDRDSPPEMSDKVDDLRSYVPYLQTRYITWSEVNRGDGDLNGIVGVPDITPLAQNWLLESNSPDKWVPSYKEVFDYCEINHQLQNPERTRRKIWWEDLDVVGDQQPNGNYGRTVGGYYIWVYSNPEGTNLIFEQDISGPDIQRRGEIRNYQRGAANGLNGWFLSHTGQIGYRVTRLIFNQFPEVWVKVRPYDQSVLRQWGVMSDLQWVEFVPNNLPIPALTTPSSKLRTGLQVRFDAAGTYDPDGDDIIRYEWDLNGDGIYEFNTGSQNYLDHTYNQAGTYATKVKATDSRNGTGTMEDAYVVTVVDRLNEIGFRDPSPTDLVISPQSVDYTVAIQIRDLAYAMRLLQGVRLTFAGDTNKVLFRNPDKPLLSDDVKVWNSEDGGKNSWGEPMSGLLNDWTMQPSEGTLVKQSIHSPPNTFVDANVLWFPVPPPPPAWRDIPVGSSGVAFEFRFTVERPHGQIIVTIAEGSGITFYLTGQDTESEFDDWSLLDYGPTGYSAVIIPSRL